jgi:hypothetical protein
VATGSGEGGLERLEAAFRRFEELPSGDAFEDKRLLVRDIGGALARHAAGAEPGQHRAIDDAAARLQLVSPEAPAHDELALELIDAAREHLADGHDHGGGNALLPAVAAAEAPGAADDRRIDEASDESFPASDPPSYTADPEHDRS